MTDEDFEIQKIITDFISSQLIAHATYLLTAAAITIALFGIFLTYKGYIIVKLILIFLFSVSFSLSIYTLGRWLYFAELTTFSMREQLVEIIEREQRIEVRKRERRTLKRKIYYILEMLKQDFKKDLEIRDKKLLRIFPVHFFSRFRRKSFVIITLILEIVLSVLYLYRCYIFSVLPFPVM